jgi:hypothetical protein
MEIDTATHEGLRGELAAIRALLDDVREQQGHLEHDTLSSLTRAIRRLQAAQTAHFGLEEMIRTPDLCSRLNVHPQTLLRHVADCQIDIRLMLDQIRVFAGRYPASQRMSPVLRVSLANVRSFARRLEGHLQATNSRLMSHFLGGTYGGDSENPGAHRFQPARRCGDEICAGTR